MHSLMNRLAELLGSDLAQRLAAEFAGQTLQFPVFYRPATEQKRLSSRDAAILAEFDGNNHEELARKHHINLQWVYRLVAQSRREAVANALQAAWGSAPQVLWVAPLTQLTVLPALEAALRAAEKARALGYQDRLAVALVILPEAPTATAQAPHPQQPVAPAETRPSTPSPSGNAPHPQAEPQPQSN